MTLLGAAVYAGFFALAAVWLFATNPDAAEEGGHHAKRQDRSKAASADTSK